MVRGFTLCAPKASRTLTPVLVKGDQLAGGTILTGVRVTRVVDRDLAEGGAVAHSAFALEAWTRDGHDHFASSAILTPWTGSRLTRVQVLAVLSDILKLTPKKREKKQELIAVSYSGDKILFSAQNAI